MNKWPKQLVKGDVIIQDGGEYVVDRVVPVFGGSWFVVFIKGHELEPVPFGGSEKVQVKG